MFMPVYTLVSSACSHTLSCVQTERVKSMVSLLPGNANSMAHVAECCIVICLSVVVRINNDV